MFVVSRSLAVSIATVPSLLKVVLDLTERRVQNEVAQSGKRPYRKCPGLKSPAEGLAGWHYEIKMFTRGGF